MPVYVQKIE